MSDPTTPVSARSDIPARAALRRIDAAADQQVQASKEAVVVLYSIRRILLWTLVVVPAALLGLAVVLGLAAQSESTKPECSYSSLC